jgi:hypothetical protein
MYNCVPDITVDVPYGVMSSNILFIFDHPIIWRCRCVRPYSPYLLVVYNIQCLNDFSQSKYAYDWGFIVLNTTFNNISVISVLLVEETASHAVVVVNPITTTTASPYDWIYNYLCNQCLSPLTF